MPAALAIFPGDSTIRKFAQTQHNVVRWTEFDRGGHFAALLAPDLLAGDLIPERGAGIEVLPQVPEGKQGNRLHLDLRMADLEAEVRRILDLGASMVTDQPVTEDGWRWHILADPDGNELCVLQPPGGEPATP